MLPVFETPHSATAFHPLSAKLFVTTANNNFFVYNVAKRRLSNWSKNAAKFPDSLLNKQDSVDMFLCA